MIEAEELKANLEAIEEKEAQEKEDIAAATKAAEEEKKSLLLRELPGEPTSGEMINIALRLPNGTRLIRNFLKNDPIKVHIYVTLVYACLRLLQGRERAERKSKAIPRLPSNRDQGR
jgi:hypothetical protein